MTKSPKRRAAVTHAWFGGIALLALATTPATAQPLGARFVAAAASTATARASASRTSVGPNLFGTVTLPVRADRFMDRWRHANTETTISPALKTLLAPARHLSAMQQIAFVQTMASRIPWRSDATQYGAHDYWATATETLAKGYGDDEDLAIVKLQALKALGFAAQDLYLMLGHDAVSGPISVLVVRTGNRFLVLNERGGLPVAPEARTGFAPIMTFGVNMAWLHGRRVAGTAIGAGGK